MPAQSVDVLITQANKAYKDHKFIEAANLFAHSAEIYDASSEWVLAAEMRNNQSVALLQANDAAGALKAASNTDDVFAKTGNYIKQAMALSNQAAALEVLGNDQEALVKFQHASELLQSTGEIEMYSMVMKRISAIQLRSHKMLESLASMNSALNSSRPSNIKERSLKKLLSILFKKENGD
jgi:tetratricopeptide (TPR) repeat protein